MSFSYDVKKELCRLNSDRDRKYSCLYGMLLFCKKFTPESIVFQTENDMVAKLFSSLVDEVVGGQGCVGMTVTEKKNTSSIYVLNVVKREHIENLIYKYRISSRSLIHRIQNENIGNNNVFSFLAGAFLSCGSIMEPIKEYHLEFVVPYKDLMNDLINILNNMGISVKSTERKGNYVIYMKGSETIEDFLTLTGATLSSINLMNIKIYKDIRNKANRIANCDSANIERTLKASENQIKDIEYIINTAGIDYLPDDLISIAELRLEYPEFSLRELGEALDKPIGRSGVNHRLKKISEIAYELRDSKI